MNIKKKIILVGGTSSIAKHCAMRWLANENIDLILIGRNLNNLNRINFDLKTRYPNSTIRSEQIDFNNVNEISNKIDNINAEGQIDIALIAHGSLSDQHVCQNDLNKCTNELQINAISPVIFAEAFAKHFEKRNHGTLAIISSVAGERGRKSNYVYGSAKALLTRYAEGLQHRFAQSKVKVVLIKPGPTDTPMTSSLKINGLKLAPVEDVSADIVKGINNGKSVIYTPLKWTIIMMIIRHMPSFIFNKLNI